jgi:hypothetical protein
VGPCGSPQHGLLPDISGHCSTHGQCHRCSCVLKNALGCGGLYKVDRTLRTAGNDVIGLAETGSGKTGAFALPILQVCSCFYCVAYLLVASPAARLTALCRVTFLPCQLLWHLDLLRRHLFPGTAPMSRILPCNPSFIFRLLCSSSRLAPGHVLVRYLYLYFQRGGAGSALHWATHQHTACRMGGGMEGCGRCASRGRVAVTCSYVLVQS